MKKIYRLKFYIFILSALFVMLCGVDYVLVYLKKEKSQILWPIYHWALGFQRIPKKAIHGYIEVLSCNGKLLDKPVSIRKFSKQNGVTYYYNSHYKYGLRMILARMEIDKNPNAQHIYQSYKKTFEANILSKFSCNTMQYNMIYMEKNFITGKEKNFLVKSMEYTKQ